MRDYRKELDSGCCKPNHGCNAHSICMCDLAEDAIDEIDRYRAYARHERDIGAESVAAADAVIIQTLIAALKDAHALINNDLVGPWVARHGLDQFLKE